MYLVLVVLHTVEHLLFVPLLSCGKVLANSWDDVGEPLNVDLAIESILHAMQIFVVKCLQVASQFVARVFILRHSLGLIIDPVGVFIVNSNLAYMSFLNAH